MARLVERRPKEQILFREFTLADFVASGDYRYASIYPLDGRTLSRGYDVSYAVRDLVLAVPTEFEADWMGFRWCLFDMASNCTPSFIEWVPFWHVGTMLDLHFRQRIAQLDGEEPPKSPAAIPQVVETHRGNYTYWGFNVKMERHMQSPILYVGCPYGFEGVRGTLRMSATLLTARDIL